MNQAREAPSFAEFYEAVNGHPPFPWQARLANEVAEREEWPAAVGLQTGLGKTACLDIAIWWLASQATRPPAQRTAPTRIWWVVNRRLLVDSTAEHAETIRDTLLRGELAVRNDLTEEERAQAETLAEQYPRSLDERALHTAAVVGERLRSISASPNAPPLQVIRLRGGVASRTPTDPSCPAILLCTLPMYGSRLLFRGYGSKLRAVDAAMAGIDSLVLLDEAHLAPHLAHLLPALADCSSSAQAVLGPRRSRPRLVALTATGNRTSDRPFELDDKDKAHPIVRKRLEAAKPLEIRERTGDGARHLAQAVQDILRDADAPSSCVVFANTPKTARAAFSRLQAHYEKKADVLLLTGLVREREAERIRKRILNPVEGMAAARGAIARQRHLIVVATQTLEVGADVDAEYLVTEACGVRALTQRLGRLNRLGQRPHARAVYVHLPPPKAEGLYGEEPAAVLQRLKDACAEDGTVALSPQRVGEVLGPPGDRVSEAPEVLPAILWEWTKTTTPPEGEAPVEPYFSGIEGLDYKVSLMWRVHLPANGQRLWPRATDREAVDVPIGEARDALSEHSLRRLTDDGVTVEEIDVDDLRPGDRIVLATDAGLMDEFGWNPSAADAVVDASLIGRGLPLDAEAIARLSGMKLGSVIRTALGGADEDEDVDETDQQEAAAQVLSEIKTAATPPGWDDAEWAGFLAELTPRVVRPRHEVPRLRVENPQAEPWSIEFDETSLGPEAVELATHGAAVAKRAGEIASNMGLGPVLTEVVEFAGRAHDVGKADGRFQRWLDPDGKRPTLVAKSDTPRSRWEATRAAAGWPRGGRHEELSARLVRAWLEQDPAWGTHVRELSADEQDVARDLFLHLVVSHHGKGRPLVSPVVDGTLADVAALVEGVQVQAKADLSIVDWEQPARFKRLSEHFGPWGLALLEAVVIRADHAVSAATNAALDPLHD